MTVTQIRCRNKKLPSFTQENIADLYSVDRFKQHSRRQSREDIQILSQT